MLEHISRSRTSSSSFDGTRFSSRKLSDKTAYGTYLGATVVGTGNNGNVPGTHTHTGGVLPAAVRPWDGAWNDGGSAVHHGWTDGVTWGVGGCCGVLRRAVPSGYRHCCDSRHGDGRVQGGGHWRLSIAIKGI